MAITSLTRLRLDLTKEEYDILNRAYYGIRTRCYNENVPEYVYYGGKGITVCDEWLADRVCFIKWCIKNGWQKGLEIDRKDGTKSYSPDNCRWVTKKVNSRNRTDNRYTVVNGQPKLLLEIAEEFGANRQTIIDKSNSGYTGDEIVSYLTGKLVGLAETRRRKRINKLDELKKIIDENYCFFQMID